MLNSFAEYINIVIECWFFLIEYKFFFEKKLLHANFFMIEFC